VFITGRQKELGEAVKVIGGTFSGVQGDVAELSDLDRLYETISRRVKLMQSFPLSMARNWPLGYTGRLANPNDCPP
jgi:hypothetical protein